MEKARQREGHPLQSVSTTRVSAVGTKLLFAPWARTHSPGPLAHTWHLPFTLDN